MDPFKALPVEIRLEILTKCNRQTVVAISHASSVLFRDRQLHKIHLAREFIAKDLLHDECLIQDAMAVVPFPFPNPDWARSRKLQADVIDVYLRLWRRKELPSFRGDGPLTHANSLAGILGARPFFFSNLEMIAGFDASEMVSLPSFREVKRFWEDAEGI